MRIMEKSRTSGFTLIETLLAVFIAVALILVIYPNYLQKREMAAASQLADSMRKYATVLSQLTREQINWTDKKTMEVMPDMIKEVLPEFNDESVIGGRWEWSANWEMQQMEIRLVDYKSGIQLISRVDQLLDDGDLSTGAVKGDQNQLAMMLPN